MKYGVQIFARKKDIDLNQKIYSNSGDFSSLKELLDDYANRYYKHKESERIKGNETNCMNETKQLSLTDVVKCTCEPHKPITKWKGDDLIWTCEICKRPC